MAEEQKKQFKVVLPENIEAGVYANAVSVHFNNNECILDMAYNMPNSKDPVIKIVSRINMSHRTAESFLKVLSNALLDWKNKQTEKSENNKKDQ
ncbi:DUF3467 domain-containing protein [Patescibacteria group bacterium]|nr:DUF3467 domain-containing protein [Patescibacteria group bacterium]